MVIICGIYGGLLLPGARDRLKQIRDYRHLSQTDVSAWFNISQAAYSKRENGNADGFSPDDFELFIHKTRIDARWLFGQIDGPIASADLDLQGAPVSAFELMRRESERLERAKAANAEDPLAHRVAIDAMLRQIVEKFARLDRPTMQRVNKKVDAILELFDIEPEESKESRAIG